MKSTIKYLVLTTLLLATFSPQAAGAAANGYRYTGLSAQLDSFTVDESGCLSEEVWVFAGREMVHDPPGPANDSPRVMVHITQQDTCNNTSSYVYGSAPLSDTQFQIDTRLESATLKIRMPVYDPEGNLAFHALIDLTWTSLGPLGRQDGSDQFGHTGNHPGFHQHYVVENRSSAA